MLFGVMFFDTTAGGSETQDTIIALAFSLLWLVVGFGYLFIRKATKGVPIFHAPDHKEKLAGVAAPATD
jgi:hypothetical protein